ncbi:serine--tRNA ligase [bacterium]|nr:MAG: serine--tRNA ligase [bacterium]
MLDINIIRENPDKVKQGLEKKRIDPKLVDKFLRVDTEWRTKVKALDELRAEQNALTKELSKEQKQDLVSRAQLLKQRIGDIETERETLEAKRNDILNNLPNLPFEDAPVSSDASGNKVLREVGEKPKFSAEEGFKPKDYLALGERLGLINVKKAGEVSGSRFGYLLKEAVLLEFGLVRLAFDVLLEEGFIPVVPPVMIKPEVYTGMGRLAGDQKEDKYYLPKDELYLVGSSEHTLGPIHLNETFEEKDLPRRYVGFSTCFRREAGSYGKDTKGILRVHQFDKVEMYSFAKPDESEKEHQFMVSLQEKLMQKLELPYRVVEISTGDMGWTDARQFDIETWMPGQGEYRETQSCSNTTDFQSRGISTKYKAKDGKKEFVHTLNGTAFAIGRTIIAIIENYQTKDGKIRVPKVLQDYVGKKEIG